MAATTLLRSSKPGLFDIVKGAILLSLHFVLNHGKDLEKLHVGPQFFLSSIVVVFPRVHLDLVEVLPKFIT